MKVIVDLVADLAWNGEKVWLCRGHDGRMTERGSVQLAAGKACEFVAGCCALCCGGELEG
jgi:hypothetical protein